jgi:hypothetical protein
MRAVPCQTAFRQDRGGESWRAIDADAIFARLLPQAGAPQRSSKAAVSRLALSWARVWERRDQATLRPNCVLNDRRCIHADQRMKTGSAPDAQTAIRMGLHEPAGGPKNYQVIYRDQTPG